jgi:ATP-binding cassette, subfamily B, bacterial HlyB/CyaB
MVEATLQQSRIAGLLGCTPLLAGLPPEQLNAVAGHGQLVRYGIGQPICRQGQPGGHLWLLIEGQARTVVRSRRLPRGIATLTRPAAGALLGVGGAWQTAIASSAVVALAIPTAGLEAVLADQVDPAELFAVLDAHLADDPRDLGAALVPAALALAGRCRVHNPDDGGPLDPDLLWLVAAGDPPLGQPVAAAPPGARLLGLEPTALAQLLEPTPEAGPSGNGHHDTGPGGNGWHRQLLERWQALQAAAEGSEPLAIGDGAALIDDSSRAPTAERPGDDDEERRRPPDSYPWHRGVGPLESAVAAFRMLSDHLNLPYRRELLQRIFGDQAQRHGEASLALAGAVAESIGLQTQLLEVPVSALPRLTMPLLLRWGNGLAVIYRCDRHGLVAGIPAAGNQLLSLEAFAEQWGESGEVLSLRVDALTPQRRFGFRWFLPALRQHRTVLIEVLVASFFVQLFGLVNPLLIQQVIDKVIINNSPDALGVLGVLLVVFALFEGLLLCLRTFLFIDTTNRIDLALGTRIIDHLLRLPLSYFDRRPVGEVSNRIGELEKVRGFLTGTALTTILDAIFALLYIGVMLLYSWQLTLLTLLVVPPLVALTLGVAPIVRRQLNSRAIANARTQSHLVEVLSSMMTVKAQNIELRSRWKWQDLYTDYVAEGFDNTLLSTTAGTISGFLNKLSSLVVIWGGAALVLQGQLSLGELIAFRIIAGYVTGPLLRMTSIWQSVQETALSLERLSDVIDHPQEAPLDNGSRLIMPAINGAIEFRNVSFRYKPSSPLLLRGVNLTIPTGCFVAVVGTSGSGKSTLTKLLARLYAPEDGTVLIDGIDIAKVELYSLRRQIGIVPQDTVLFDGSVEENITLTQPEAGSEEVIEAARVAAAHDFIMALPAGYSTQVGERGSSLSGGQRQRLAIARTILSKPRLLIMDEATSALDYQTERQVSQNLMQTLQGCTVLFITHRLSSIVKADLIVCMGQGAVLEVGRHEELMQARGAYYALYCQQGGQ